MIDYFPVVFFGPTFLRHASCHSELGGVVGGPVALGLPGLLLGHDQLLPILDGHVSLDALALRLRLRYSLRGPRQRETKDDCVTGDVFTTINHQAGMFDAF